MANPLAVVTGASSGIGLEMARLLSKKGYDLIIASDTSEIEDAEMELSESGSACESVQCDLSTRQGVAQLISAIDIAGVAVDVLVANAGVGLGDAFLKQNFDEALKVVHTNVDGTIELVHNVGRRMQAQRTGRILITGSIAGLMPGTYQAVYNGSKAFLDSFAAALHAELKDTGVSVTCLMPGATETDFFERAGMGNTQIGSSEKQSAADVANIGIDALFAGERSVVAGLKNKFQAAMSHILPDSVLAEMHRKMAAPGSGKDEVPKSRVERTDVPYADTDKATIANRH
jgi:short-subunit dehydrogenase